LVPLAPDQLRSAYRFLPTTRVVAESEDLSRRGLFVRTDELLPVGALLDVDLTLPDGTVFRATARVAHLLPPSSAKALGRHVGMGLELVDGGDGTVASLGEYLDEMIHDLTPPPHACATWRALYDALGVFRADLLEHIHLENDILFARNSRRPDF
jgi:hypothetical protein